MQATVHSAISVEALGTRLPAAYREILLPLGPEAVATAVVFPTSTKVVPSGLLSRTLKHIDDRERLIVFAQGFTEEARATLRARDAIIAQLGEYYWTDESWESVRG